MGKRFYPEDTTLADLERRIAALERSRTGGFSADGETTYLRDARDLVIDGGTIQVIEADGSILTLLDGTRLRFNRSDGLRQLEITPGGGLKIYAADGTTEKVVLSAAGLTVDGGNNVATYTDVKEGSAAGVTLTSTMSEHANATFTLPSWVKTAKVFATCYIQVTNATANTWHIRASCQINDVFDGSGQVTAPTGRIAQAVHLDESTINTAVDGFSVQISAYGQHVGTSPGDDSVANAAVWGIIIGYAT